MQDHAVSAASSAAPINPEEQAEKKKSVENQVKDQCMECFKTSLSNSPDKTNNNLKLDQNQAVEKLEMLKDEVKSQQSKDKIAQLIDNLQKLNVQKVNSLEQIQQFIETSFKMQVIMDP